MMFPFRSFSVSLLLTLSVTWLGATHSISPELDTAWLEENLRYDHPRLLWNPEDDSRLADRAQTDPLVSHLHEYLLARSDALLSLAPLEHKLEGRRLLDVSRSALQRITHFAYAWRTTRQPHYLEALESSLRNVCAFPDWNPSHFLDTAEMSLAVAIGYDWAHDALSEELRDICVEALIEKAILPAQIQAEEGTFAFPNNWNQVCNAGIVAAALCVAEKAPGLAAEALQRMRAGLPAAMETYEPDGVYVEGPTYWEYGTEFTVTLLSLLRSALGTDFDLIDSPAFAESADFIHLMRGPSGRYFDFSDCWDRSQINWALFWFAKEEGKMRHLQTDALLKLDSKSIDTGNVSLRIAPFGMLWLLHTQERPARSLPLSWVGQGENPIGVFRSSFDDPGALYLAFKGGKGTNPHGNMDAGTFIFELDGVRWAEDMGVQGYHELEEFFSETGGDLWSSEPGSVRWDLLTKNNFGHNTLTVGEALHVNDGHATIDSFNAENRTANLDLSAALGDSIKSAQRTFRVIDDRTVEIEDRVSFKTDAQPLRWQMITHAEVLTTETGAILLQDGERLSMQIFSPEGARFTVTSLTPPPHPMDKSIGGLKRIDLTLPAYLTLSGKSVIRVRLTGDLSESSSALFD